MDDNNQISKEVNPLRSAGGSVRVQEYVVGVDVSQVIPNDDILVWGDQRGDRILAGTVLLRGMIAAKPGAPAGGSK